MGIFWIIKLNFDTFLERSQAFFLFLELITIPHKSRGEIHGWPNPNVPGVSGLGMMCLGMACLYAPIIMDLGNRFGLEIDVITLALQKFKQKFNTDVWK